MERPRERPITRESTIRLGIGLLVPATNLVMAEEFRMMSPEGVKVYVARVAVRERNPADSFEEVLRKQIAAVPEAASTISFVDPDIVAFGCTSASFLEGEEGNKKITDEISRLTNCPVITTSTAVISALQALKMKRIAVATPYPSPTNESLVSYLESRGIAVSELSAAPLEAKWLKYAAYRLVKGMKLENIDGVFVSCTDFWTIETLACLEKDIQMPVISSNQAHFWACMRQAKIRDEIQGFGSLFDLL